MPTLDAANISFNLLKAASGGGVTLGPILLGVAKPVHILTPSATVRRIVNMTALTVVDSAMRAAGAAVLTSGRRALLRQRMAAATRTRSSVSSSDPFAYIGAARRRQWRRCEARVSTARSNPCRDRVATRPLLGQRGSLRRS